jgi:GT2 family glycosyltransferase
MAVKVGFSIPAYADPDSLRRCLESIYREVDESAEIVVVDDSGDGRIREALCQTFGSVKWVVHEENQGFGQTANQAILDNSADLVVLLNDDIQILEFPVESLARLFEDERLFGVTFRSFDETERFREGAKRLVWRFGYPRILHNERDQFPLLDHRYFSSYAVGGHAAFHRAKFLALGGFDSLFDPFYWEDVDLAARAAAAGWHCLYSPEFTVSHSSQGAIRSTYDIAMIREITQRNRLLFGWRHGSLRQRGLLGLSLRWNLLIARIKGDRIFPRALSEARERWRLQANGRPTISESTGGVVR